MIGLIGLDYQRADGEVRGRLSLAGERLAQALHELAALEAVDEVAVLSTCNRTEVYIASGDLDAALAQVRSVLVQLGAAWARRTAGASDQLAMESAGTQPAVSTRTALDVADLLVSRSGLVAVRHLFRVAAGLQSMVVGEAQILGQVREALAAAEQARTMGDELRALFTSALKVGKRVRTETAIGRADVSVAALAVAMACELLGGLHSLRALIIGAGRTSRLCAELLRAEGIGGMVLANRTARTAADLAAAVGADAIDLTEIEQPLAEVDLVMSATAAPYAVLTAEMVARARGGRVTPLVVVDLAVPVDVEDAVRALPGVTLLTLDDLRERAGAAAGDASTRASALDAADAIIAGGLRGYVRERTVRAVVPGIAALRAHVDRSEQAELARALERLAHLSPEDRQVVERFGQRLVDKMFHHLVSRVRSLAEYDEVPPDVTLQVLARLFVDPDRPPPSDPSGNATDGRPR